MTSDKNERKLELRYSGGDWVNFRSALAVPVRSKPGAYRKTTRDVRDQGYHLRECRWSTTNVPLTESEKVDALRLIREMGLEREGC